MKRLSLSAGAAALALAGLAVGAAPVPEGKAVFDQWCAGCHMPLPGDMLDPPAGTHRLEIKYHGAKPAALEQRTDLTPDLIRALVRQGVNMMPRARKTEISDAQLDALVDYLTHKP